MKSLLFAFTAIALSGMALAPVYEGYVASGAIDDAPKITKQNVLDDITLLEVDNKKDKKRIDKAKKELEKSLEEKLWTDDFTLSMLGKKVFTHDKKAIKQLSKITSIDVSDFILSLVESDRTLAQSAIDSVPDDAGIKKVDKKIAKAIKEMGNAQKDLDKNKTDKAIDHFKKAWKLAKMGESIDVVENDVGVIDMNNDGVNDYFVEIKLTGKSNKPIKLNYEIQNECVDLGPKDPSDIGGDTFEDATMLIGVSALDRVWLIDDMKVWNEWFKQNDENKIVDLIFWDSRFLPRFHFLSGDSVIQGDGENNSFTQFASLTQIGGQSGWSGSLFFNAPPGDYIFWTIHPAGGIDGCDLLAGAGVHVIIP